MKAESAREDAGDDIIAKNCCLQLLTSWRCLQIVIAVQKVMCVFTVTALFSFLFFFFFFF